ncbi:SDR family oxidoreductase [bacterium]|nr:SDR family oxidoreductase [bacterium]
MGRRILVTGGAGFIGSHIVEHLVRCGDAVRVLDNFSSGRRENLAAVLAEIELVEGDLRDATTVRRAVEGCDYVIHQGAIPSVPRSVADPLTTHEVNATGTLNLLLAARDAGVRRVVSASSSSVYGETAELPKREDMLPRPLSPYAASKIMLEYYQAMFYRLYGLETVSLRYFNVFGPRQDPTSQYAAVVPIFAVKLLAGERPTIYGDGEQTRDFTYIDNVVEANLTALTAANAAGRVFNIACGQATTVNALYREIARLVGSDLAPIYAPPRAGDIRDSVADVSLARDLLGLSPRVDLVEGLRRTIQSFRP